MNLSFAELHAAALLSQDPAVLAGARECNRVTPAQTLLGECFDALGLWSERIDGISFEPVEEACRRRVWVSQRMAA